MRTRFRIFVIGIGLTAVTYIGGARAACTGYQSTNSQLSVADTISAKRDVAVGTVVYDSGWITDGKRADVHCSGAYSWTMGYASAISPVSGMSDVYQTGVPGLGIKVLYDNTNPPGGGIVMRWPQSTSSLSGSAQFTPWGLFRVQYIVFGPLSSGTMTIPSPTATVSYGGVLANRVTFNRTTVNIVSVGCRLTNSDVAVALPTVSVSDFAGAGSTVGPKNFAIDLNCDSNVAVSYRIDGTPPSGIPANNGVLATVAGAGQASGVGVQLKRDGTTVPLGTKLSYIRTTTNAQAVSIPLTGAYYATTTAPSGGAVTAVATFTLFYE